MHWQSFSIAVFALCPLIAAMDGPCGVKVDNLQILRDFTPSPKADKGAYIRFTLNPDFRSRMFFCNKLKGYMNSEGSALVLFPHNQGQQFFAVAPDTVTVTFGKKQGCAHYKITRWIATDRADSVVADEDYCPKERSDPIRVGDPQAW